MKPKLSEQEIAARIELGKRFMKRFAQNDRDASAKFRDASNVPGYIVADESGDENDGGDVPADVAVGQSNLLGTNVITKVASIAIANPDWHVKTHTAQAQAGPIAPQIDPNGISSAEIVRQFLREKWRLNNWVRLSQKALYKRYVAGMGVVAYRWDEANRATLEHVQSWDLAIDPNVRDWRKVDWAARKIKMSVRKARERYPKADFPQLADGSAAADSTKVEIWLYYDADNECHVWKGELLECNENLYKSVPFVFFEGDIDPGRSMFPLSDWDLASGLQTELSDLNLQISNSAKHGGVINMVDMSRLDAAGKEQLESGVQQGFIPVKDLVTPPIHRIEGEPMAATLLEAKREAQGALDAVTGVSQYDRGVIDQGAKFATEVATIQQRGNARGIQGRLEFELFLNRMAEVVIMLEAEFGGPDDAFPEQHTDEQMILWESLQDVTEVSVLEASTTYKDPTFELQQGMQLLNLAAQTFPLFAQVGLPVPNLQQFLDDILRAAGKYDLSRYWMAPPPPPMMMPPGPDGQPQAPAGPGGDGSLPPGNVPTSPMNQ